MLPYIRLPYKRSVVYLPLAEVVDLRGRGEVAERVQYGAEAEQDVGVVGAR